MSSKVRASDLAQVLRALPLVIDPNVIVGLAPADDAAVVRLSDELALVFATDFFTPLVDDPPPSRTSPPSTRSPTCTPWGESPSSRSTSCASRRRRSGWSSWGRSSPAATNVAREAGISIAGGHSVEDAEPKYGLAVIGTVHPGRPREGGALPGDRLVLTKPLGTGVLATALKRDRLAEASPEMVAAIRSIQRHLNARAAALAGKSGWRSTRGRT